MASKFLCSSILVIAQLWTYAASQQTPTEWTVTPFNPFRLPLAVRNPYLNTWLAQGNNPPKLGEGWARFWSTIVSNVKADYAILEPVHG